MATRSLIPQFRSRNAPSPMHSDPFTTLQEEMNRLFESFGSFPAASWSSDMAPRMDVCETEQEIDIDAELPGMDESNVEVNVGGDTLTISGERKDERNDRDRNYRISERSYGRFSRSLSLPFDVDPKNVSATFDKGVLHIAVRKPENATRKSAKIPVKSG
jgi:HSP20 family protein